MFPFEMRSLTKSIDDEIHRAVRDQAPGKYLAFRILDFVARTGYAIGAAALILYGATYTMARMGGLQDQGVADIVKAFAMVIAASIAAGFIAGLARETLLKDLEKMARSALARVLAK
jgi:hypothetical protein